MIPGSHLEKLYHLRRRIDDEIRIAERQAGKRQKVRRKRAAPSGPSVESRAAEHGLTARQVKEWAHAQGLIPAIARGRLSGELLDAYLDAHTQPEEVA